MAHHALACCCCCCCCCCRSKPAAHQGGLVRRLWPQVQHVRQPQLLSPHPLAASRNDCPRTALAQWRLGHGQSWQQFSAPHAPLALWKHLCYQCCLLARRLEGLPPAAASARPAAWHELAVEARNVARGAPRRDATNTEAPHAERGGDKRRMSMISRKQSCIAGVQVLRNRRF